MPPNPHPERRRISQACKPCGKRKVKCDGGVPRCGRCTSDSIQCSYGESKRNKWLSSSSSYSSTPERSARSQAQLSSQGSLAEPSHRSENTFPTTTSKTISLPFTVSRRLLQAYFRCIHPIWPILYKPLFSSLNHEQLLEQLPRSLLHAILSLAVLIHEPENDELSKFDQAQRFFDEALKALKDPGPPQSSHSLVEVNPSITNCQVYTILALQQHGIGALSSAGTLCAIASSMAIDLSLHRKSETHGHIEAQVKSRLWWSIYALEKMLSCEVGRPILLRAEEVDAPFPSVEESDEFEFYSGSAGESALSNYKNHSSLKLRTISAFHTSIRIAMIMEKVSREIYSVSARQRIRCDREAGKETRLKLWAELQEYESAMERSPLKLDMTGSSASAPVTVTNYIFMWSTTILLHRPFIENWQTSGNDATGSLIHRDPSQICLYAAFQICAVIEMYTRYMCGLPSDLVFPIFLSTNILQRHWQQTEGRDIGIKQRLDICASWLTGLGKSWKNADQRRQMLAESISSTSFDAHIKAPEPSYETSEAVNSFDGDSNLMLFSPEDDFDLDYLQWVNSLDMQNLFEKDMTC